MPDPSRIVATDCGSTTTKAILIERRNGEYRLQGRGEAPTTVEAPFDDVTVGVLNAVGELEELTQRRFIEEARVRTPIAADAGADAFSAINTLGGPNPELSNQFGGLSGARIFPATLEAVRRIRAVADLPLIVMGGIRGAADIRLLEEIDSSSFYAIGTALGGLDSGGIRIYFEQLERDLAEGTDEAARMTLSEMLIEYRPFTVSEIEEFGPSLRLLKFHQNLDAGVGQFVFLKVGHGLSRPFSVARDRDHLELGIRKVGKMTAAAFQLRPNDVVRISGPFGRSFSLPPGRLVIFVGAGIGIPPITHAAEHHEGPKRFVIGAVTADELVYLDEFRKMGEVAFSTDDGSAGFRGLITDLLEEELNREKPENACFYTCGPEVAIEGVDRIARRYAPPEDIFHLVERMTSCGIGICGKCSVPSGERACVDGPVFTAADFTPGQYTRDKTGKRVPVH